jgi:hypothetical protein
MINGPIPAEEAPHTAEAVAKDLRGSIEFHRHGTVARFHRAEDYRTFVEWLQGRGCYRMLDAGSSALCVMYAAKLTA